MGDCCPPSEMEASRKVMGPGTAKASQDHEAVPPRPEGFTLGFPLAEASPLNEIGNGMREEFHSGCPCIGRWQLMGPMGEWGHSDGAPECLPTMTAGRATSRLKAQTEDQESPDGRPGGPRAHCPPHWQQ